ncbi:hypothetical protein GAV44_23265 [Salmonella enterica subsp. enterica serovar Newport]|nr:hypothetical protein [Salmonella enterica subsp. enterica serovar Newport]
MDFNKMIEDGFINTVKSEDGKIFYVWSDKVPREKVPNPDIVDGIYFDRSLFFKGKPCKQCDSVIRYQTTKICVKCSREKTKKYKAEARNIE